MSSQNQKSRCRMLVVACVLISSASAASAESPFSEMVSFGASWDMNRWTNGLAWPSWLASELDVPAPEVTGTHYGFGCANTTDWRNQVTDYLNARTPDDTTLITLAAGYGEVGFCVARPFPTETTLDNVTNAVSRLAEAGGKHFVVPTHGYDDKPELNVHFDRDEMVALNSSLDVLLAELAQTYGITVYRPDFFQLWDDMRTAPADFGITNIDDTIGDAPNPHEYWWSDPRHPTTAVHRIG